MANHKPLFNIDSFGIYKEWRDTGKALPSLVKCTTLVPANIDVEFGLVMSVKRGKGIVLDWHIKHPDITDKKGRSMAPFSGQVQVRNNDWQFYLGDTIWAPVHDKVGDWRMYISYQNTIVVDKTFELTQACLEEQAEQQFWKRRGF